MEARLQEREGELEEKSKAVETNGHDIEYLHKQLNDDAMKATAVAMKTDLKHVRVNTCGIYGT